MFSMANHSGVDHVHRPGALRVRIPTSGQIPNRHMDVLATADFLKPVV